VTLPRPEIVSAVVVELYYPFDEFPRRLLIEASEDGEAWRRVPYADGPEERWALLDELVRTPRESRAVYRLPPTPLRALRLALSYREHDDAWPQWSVPELRLYRACR
jgi:hypothetical protein